MMRLRHNTPPPEQSQASFLYSVVHSEIEMALIPIRAIECAFATNTEDVILRPASLHHWIRQRLGRLKDLQPVHAVRFRNAQSIVIPFFKIDYAKDCHPERRRYAWIAFTMNPWRRPKDL